MIIEIKLSELIVGHYVIDIKKQEKKFKLSSSCHVKSTAVINNLRKKGVETVLIDDEKTIVAELDGIQESVEISAEHLSPSEITPEKLRVAREIFNESKVIQQKIFSDA